MNQSTDGVRTIIIQLFPKSPTSELYWIEHRAYNTRIWGFGRILYSNHNRSLLFVILYLLFRTEMCILYLSYHFFLEVLPFFSNFKVKKFALSLRLEFLSNNGLFKTLGTLRIEWNIFFIMRWPWTFMDQGLNDRFLCIVQRFIC